MSKNSARAKNGMVRGIVTVALVVLMCLSVLPLMTFETGASIPIPTTISIPKTILVDTDWDSGTCTMSANVTVKSPATLRIANATIDIVNNWTSHDSGGGHNKSLMGYSPFADFGKYFGFKVENGAKLIIYNTTIRGKTKADKYNIIIDGTVDIRSSTFKNLDYDGILVDGDDGVHPVLKNNKFITVTDALTIYNTTSSILNTTFSTVDNNGIYFMNSTLTIKDDTFSGTYNAIRGEQSTCTIEKNTIGLTNTGIYLYNGDCTIKNNTINGDPKGYTGIDLESPKGSYYVNDNEIYDLYNGILSYGNSMVFINTVHDCDVGIAMYNKGGGGGNKTMAVTGINIVWNTLTTIRYQGIVVYGGNNIDVSNNTITTVGTNWDTGQGISLGLATGTVADNNISDVQGYGISLNQGANGITFSNNAISNVRAGNNGVEQTGGVSIEYADQFAQWDLYPSYFYFNKVAIPFRFNNAGTINLWAFDLTGKDLGTTMDILEIGEWISTDVYLYNTFYDDYKLEAYPYGPQVQSSITVSWSTNFHGFWESSNDPVVMGTVTVNDTYGEPAFQGRAVLPRPDLRGQDIGTVQQLDHEEGLLPVPVPARGRRQGVHLHERDERHDNRYKLHRDDLGRRHPVPQDNLAYRRHPHQCYEHSGDREHRTPVPCDYKQCEGRCHPGRGLLGHGTAPKRGEEHDNGTLRRQGQEPGDKEGQCHPRHDLAGARLHIP